MNENEPLILPRKNKNGSSNELAYLMRENIEDDPTVILGNTIMLKIFSYLEISDLGNCSSVNKRWKTLSSDNCLFAPLSFWLYYHFSRKKFSFSFLKKKVEKTIHSAL